MHMNALILEMCPSVLVWDVITSYTTLNANPEKLQRMYQETTASICWKMSDVCFLCYTLFCVSNLSRKESAHSSTQWCNYFLCWHVATATVITVICRQKSCHFSKCSELLKVIMLFLIKQFSSLAQRLLSEQHSVCKVTLGCHHLDARVVRSVCIITSHPPKAAFRAVPASPICSLSLPGKAANSSHVFGGKKGWNEQKRSISSKELRSSVEGNKRKLQDDNVENRAFFSLGVEVGVGGWKEEVCRDKETVARCTSSLRQRRSWPQIHADSYHEKGAALSEDPSQHTGWRGAGNSQTSVWRDRRAR